MSKELIKWQAISFISRGAAMALGIVQSIVIVRILSVSEYGLINIALAVGAAFGIYQHLGLASGSTREISAASDNKEIFKIFTTSVLIRYFVSVPLAVILFVLSKYIAISKYASPELVIPLKIFAFVLLIQGVQSIFNSVISGTQRFRRLFIYQTVIAAVSLFIYIPLIYLYRLNGYFIALALFNLVGSISLGIISLKPLKGSFVLPSRDDLKRLLRDILSISLAVYVVKIIYTYWQRLGPLLLGLSVSPEQVGVFSFALLYAGKLMTISDAITDVNLPVLSKKYVEDIKGFRILFTRNFDKVYAFIVFSAAAAVFWSQEVIRLLVGSGKYDLSFPFILPLVFAFIFYSLVNIVKSSILIPARMSLEMIASFLLMLGVTTGVYFIARPSVGSLPAMAYGMLFGSLSGLAALFAATFYKLRFSFMNFFHLIILVISLALCVSGSFGFLAKTAIFVLFLLFYTWIVFRFKVATRDQVVFLKNKVLSLISPGTQKE